MLWFYCVCSRVLFVFALNVFVGFVRFLVWCCVCCVVVCVFLLCSCVSVRSRLNNVFVCIVMNCVRLQVFAFVALL